MRSDEGNTSDGVRIDRGNRDSEGRGSAYPGSRRSRLANASKQLGVLMEEVDIDAEPELAEALTEAVIAVDRACRQVDGRADGRSGREDSPVPADDGVLARTTGGHPRAPLAVDRERPSAGGSETE